MKRCFEKNGAAKDSHFKKKNLFEKENMGSSRVQGSGLQFGKIPFFLPPQEITVYVRYFKPMFFSGN